MTFTSLGKRLERLSTRLRAEFLLSSRMDEYRQLLQAALDHGYQVIDNEQWVNRVQTGQVEGTTQKILVMRHDIDTDPGLAPLWHRTEAALGCRASYFFRLSTMHEEIVRQLARQGVHVSYHFEELADVAKRQRIRTPSAARDVMPAACELFEENIAALRARFDLPMDIVCSHGDWMNRHLKMPNHLLLQDPALRQRLNIRSECYDDDVMQAFAAYTSDGSRAFHWTHGDPLALMAAGTSPLGILTHPKAWRAHWGANISELSHRLQEACAFRFGSGWR